MFQIRPLQEDVSYDELIAEGEWDCTLRATEYEGVLMILYLDCTDGGVEVAAERTTIGIEANPNPSWREFAAGLAVTYSWRVTTHGWGYYWWARLARDDGAVLLNAYLTGEELAQTIMETVTRIDEFRAIFTELIEQYRA